MTYTCKGTARHLAVPHTHESAIEAKICYGLVPSYVTPPPPPPVVKPFTFGSRYAPEGPLSRAQYNYISDLKGDLAHAKTLSYRQASNYINELKGGSRVEPTTTDPRLDMLDGLMELVNDGYYATRLEDGAAITFMRVSKPNRGKYKDTTKIQTVHGSGMGGVRLEEAAVQWRPGRWSIRKPFIIDELLILCADTFSAAMLYSEHIGRCCRCNAELTDDRSRWYGIGPECEKYWGWVIDLVHEKKGAWRGQHSS